MSHSGACRDSGVPGLGPQKMACIFVVQNAMPTGRIASLRRTGGIAGFAAGLQAACWGAITCGALFGGALAVPELVVESCSINLPSSANDAAHTPTRPRTARAPRCVHASASSTVVCCSSKCRLTDFLAPRLSPS